MSNVVDISELTTVSLDLNQVTNLSETYSKYSLFVESRNDPEDNTDTPYEYKYNLYNLYNAGIDNFYDDGWNITIGEKITSKTQIICDKNYDTINDTQFHEVDDVIEFDKINEFVKELHELADDPDYTDVSVENVIYEWFSNLPGINLNINQNPEDADDTNMILTQNARNDIQQITESILNKFFRNMMQLVRVLHEYRLYGHGTTIFGGASTELSSTEKMRKWSALPKSCWTEYSGNYVVGSKAYDEEIPEIETGLIKNSRYYIGPYNSWGIASHKHDVEFNMTQLPTTLSFSNRSVCGDFTPTSTHTSAAVVKAKDRGLTWRQAANAVLPPTTVKGVAQKGQPANINKIISWHYSWQSNDYCKLTSRSNVENIFKESNTFLPTYSTYVWKWTGNDDTDIYDPSAYLK